MIGDAFIFASQLTVADAVRPFFNATGFIGRFLHIWVVYLVCHYLGRILRWLMAS